MTPLSPLPITDYAKNDVNFVLSVLSLEELGARGNKGLAGLVNNPVHSAAIAGLATSATAQATIEVRGLSPVRRTEAQHDHADVSHVMEDTWCVCWGQW